MEQEPFFTIKNDGEKVRCDRYNTMANTYLGELSCFNHIYVDTDINDPDANALYIFKGNEGYDKIIKFIIEHKFMALINQFEVEDIVRETWGKTQIKELRTFNEVPKEWEQ